jgi:hypothetical protein
MIFIFFSFSVVAYESLRYEPPRIDDDAAASTGNVARKMDFDDRIENAIVHLAVATLAVGERARSFTTTLIHSFVRNGAANLDCPLYIVTEDDSYFRKTLDALNPNGK